MDDRKEFKERLAILLEDIFDELKQNSKTLAEACILPASNMTITIKPIGDLTFEEIPSIEVTYEFLPSKESINKFFKKEK